MFVNRLFIDAGIDHIHLQEYDIDFKLSFEQVIKNTDSFSKLIESNTYLKDIKYKTEKPATFITGKLSEIVKKTLGFGVIISSKAAIWSEAKALIKSQSEDIKTLAILDLSASGYMLISVNREGLLVNDLLVVNPRCGAGSGVNLSRILEKLDIKKDEVDTVLKTYLGIEAKDRRQGVPIRADRCGVFSSSATISDKNQGIPLDYALAVTMKSEVLKACKKITSTVDIVYLTGRIFEWSYARECAEDYFKSIGVKQVIYDEKQEILIKGVIALSDAIGVDNFREENKAKLARQEKLDSLPGFTFLNKTLTESKLYKRLEDSIIPKLSDIKLDNIPVFIGLDVGSTMAKMVIVDARTGELLFKSAQSNHGDTIETIKYLFKMIIDKGIEHLLIQRIGITGSGRYQVKKALENIYPHLADRIEVLVENYAHARGSIGYAKEHIKELQAEGKAVNEGFCLLIDIGGEDTKISVISLEKEELFDNAMNIKCSAGTGSLMDTLKSLFGIEDISEACRKAYQADKAYSINATCAVFLIENARKMQSDGYNIDDILASCNHAIVENMARTLWNKLDIPKNAVVLLHGQTMLSDPLPLATAYRLQEYANTEMYCIVPPFAGHRACLGLTKQFEYDELTAIHEVSDLNKLVDHYFEKRIFHCRGLACGDDNACCSRTSLKSSSSEENPIILTLGGCTAINDLESKRKENFKTKANNTYKAIWEMIDLKLPRSTEPNRFIIPRAFSISEYSYFFGMLFKRLGIPVHIDNVRDTDVLEGQPLVQVDTCAPLIGAVGQYCRLASEPHGHIWVPQIDFLPTEGKSLGRTCTVNQGGVLIAMHYAQMRHRDARFLVSQISLKEMDAKHIAAQLYGQLSPIFEQYNVNITIQEFINIIEMSLKDHYQLKELVTDKISDVIEEAIKDSKHIAIVCGREYILNPGIYDSHVGKLLSEKGVVTIPSYAFEVELDKNCGYIYWKNPHDMLTKIDAISKKQLHKIVINKRLALLFKEIEEGITETTLSHIQVSTFRCGPDTIIVPIAEELSKHCPSLLIQSDGVIKELAHLENRVNTHLNQVDKKLHDAFDKIANNSFKVEVLSDYQVNHINKNTDVVCFVTMGDNRTLISTVRASGITVIDNYTDESYDLVKKTKLGRKYLGEEVCSPMSATYGDLLYAAEEFSKRKNDGDPEFCDKTRLLVFIFTGTGPCRLGQFVNRESLCLHQSKCHSCSLKQNDLPSIDVSILAGSEENQYDIGIDEWARFASLFLTTILAVQNKILFTYGALCNSREQLEEFYFDWNKLKQEILSIIENKVKPSNKILSFVNTISKPFPMLGYILKYFCYGMHNSYGLKTPIDRFVKKWGKNKSNNHSAIKVFVDGEVYLREAQIEELFKSLIDIVGLGNFTLSYTPCQTYLEYSFVLNIQDKQELINLKKGLIDISHDKNEKQHLQKEIKLLEKEIKQYEFATTLFRKLIINPLYKAAGLKPMKSVIEIFEIAKKIIPYGKPQGEFPLYTGISLDRLNNGTDLFISLAPESCMVSNMSELLGEKILDTIKTKGKIQSLYNLNGEINTETLEMAMLKILGPEGFYIK